MSTSPGASGIRTAPDTESRDVRGYWPVSLVRAIAALTLGLVITFTADHSSQLGLVGLGGFALISGGVLLARRTRTSRDAMSRALLTAAAVVSVAVGLVALVSSGSGAATLIYLGAAWALVVGGLELAAGLRDRGVNRAASDWIAVGGLSLLLGIVLLVVPPDLSAPFQGERGNTGVLTGSLHAVGFLGAWAVIVGVLLAIGTFSLTGRGDARSAAPAAAPAPSPSPSSGRDS